MANENKVPLTYETLYEISLREKQRESLQELDSNFWRQTLSYLREKQAMLDDNRKKVDIFSAAEREQTMQQIRNIKRILHEIYNRREKKIIDIALNKSRTASKLIDTSNMIDIERQFFDSLVNEMNLFRQGLLHNILSMMEPSVWLGEEAEQESLQPVPDIPLGMAAVAVHRDISQFLGKELEVYGPFKSGEQIILPVDIAQILVRKGDATLTSDEPRTDVELGMETQPPSVSDTHVMAQE